ncbi:hypothetical protein [Methylophilus sp. QUAN]|uniref:hypothetical protein n=1 Tax=Methylophilus sp. QUAN TaxID=2781020 RepID=UPI00188E4E5D|nr:hypothetical protein [Methylophilus sp. QUAN]MBF4990662.1 hypothetical protein [Methylophilus sp. QUAN]
MCDENGLFAEAEVTDGMLLSKRRFKRNLMRPLLSLKERIEVTLDENDISLFTGIMYVVAAITLLGLLINGVVSLYHLLEVTRPLVLPLGGWNAP